MTSAFRIASRMIMLGHGSIVAQGTPDEIRNSPNPEVQQFINVTDLPLKAVSQKLNPEKLSDMIENYAEFCDWINKNGYSKYLD